MVSQEQSEPGAQRCPLEVEACMAKLCSPTAVPAVALGS